MYNIFLKYWNNFWLNFEWFLHRNMVIYTVIILLPQGFYILCAGFFFRSIRFLHANLARLCIPIQQRSRLQTLVSSYHSTTSAQRTPSVDSCANSQCFPGLLERGHLSAKSIRGARNENMENMENLTLSLLYKPLISIFSFQVLTRI